MGREEVMTEFREAYYVIVNQPALRNDKEGGVWELTGTDWNREDN